MTVKLENWSCCSTINDPYMAPELKAQLGGVCLQGKIFGDPRFPDGKHIVTSSIKSAKGKFAKTKHTEYELGEVNPDFKKFVEKCGRVWDDDSPFNEIEEK